MNEIQPTRTDVLVRRLNLMAETGGLLSRDRIKTVREAAGRLRELDEAVRILKGEERKEVTGG